MKRVLRSAFRSAGVFAQWAGSGIGGSWILGCLLLSSRLWTAEAASARQDEPMLRFALSSNMFREVNENDARASLKIYAKTIAETQGLTADPKPCIFAGIGEITQLLSARMVDVISLPTTEFLLLDSNLVMGPILVTVSKDRELEDYVLLVRAESGIHALSDLKARHLQVFDGLNGSLAQCWLEVLLGEQQLGLPDEFLTVTRHIKTIQTVLPVFFQHADACIVTGQGFALMGELNPQITNQLRVLASSPQVLPLVTCFRAGLDRNLLARVLLAVADGNTNPVGKQIMTIFQSGHVEPRPLLILQSARELVAARDRLRGELSNSEPTSAAFPSSPHRGRGQ